jgi:hypothetical protein
MSTRLEKTAKYATVIAIVFAVFLALAGAASQINVEAVPEVLQPYVAGFVAFFAVGLGASGVAVVRNGTGYLRVYFESQPAYDFSRLYETIALYVGYIGTVMSAITVLKTMLPQFAQYFEIIGFFFATLLVFFDILLPELARAGLGKRKG